MMKKDKRQAGASLAEFMVAVPIVMIVGMATVQAGLIYHGKTTLNYATFEAVRAGAVNNAQIEVMRTALGLRLAPVQGGDGSAQKALEALAKSALAVQDPVGTHIRVINPTTEAFDDWGVNSQSTDVRVIPNNHLRHKTHEVGATSGLSLRDANLLKIHVTHGIDMKVPVVSSIIARSMALIDPTNAHFYARNKFPVSSVATVRMQSEAWEDETVMVSVASLEAEAASEAEAAAYQPVVDRTADVAVVGTGDSDNGNVSGENQDGTGDAEVDGVGHSQASEESSESCEAQTNGLGSSPILIDASAYADNQCAIEDVNYGPGNLLGSSEDVTSPVVCD